MPIGAGYASGRSMRSTSNGKAPLPCVVVAGIATFRRFRYGGMAIKLPTWILTARTRRHKDASRWQLSTAGTIRLRQVCGGIDQTQASHVVHRELGSRVSRSVLTPWRMAGTRNARRTPLAAVASSIGARPVTIASRQIPYLEPGPVVVVMGAVYQEPSVMYQAGDTVASSGAGVDSSILSVLDVASDMRSSDRFLRIES